MYRVIIPFVFLLAIPSLSLKAQVQEHASKGTGTSQANTQKHIFHIGIHDIEPIEVQFVKDLKNQHASISAIFYCEAQNVFRIHFSTTDLEFDPSTILIYIQQHLPQRTLVHKAITEGDNFELYCKFD